MGVSLVVIWRFFVEGTACGCRGPNLVEFGAWFLFWMRESCVNRERQVRPEERGSVGCLGEREGGGLAVGCVGAVQGIVCGLTNWLDMAVCVGIEDKRRGWVGSCVWYGAMHCLPFLFIVLLIIHYIFSFRVCGVGLPWVRAG